MFNYNNNNVSLSFSAPKMVCRLISAFLKTYLLVAFASGICLYFFYKMKSKYSLTKQIYCS